MARLAVSKDYFGAYSRLPRKAQRKADEFLTKFQRDSTSAAIHLEPVQGALDRQLRSARIGDDYRVIVRQPEQGDVFLVLWADHHDEAYRWAAGKETAIHPVTGSLQIFEAGAAPPPVSEPSTPAAARSPGLFDRFTDDQLFLAGVPRALVPSVRHVANDEELDALAKHLPSEAGEVLTGLAAGLGLDEVMEEVLGREAPSAAAPPAPPVDITDVAAALARDTTQRQFRLIEGEAELDAALRHPLDVWRVFLHPRQRKIAHARTKGPTRVLGGAGTGKTVVALHRVAFLVREVFKKPDDRILLTTFNTNLADDLQTQLGKLLEPDELARVVVVNIDAWAARFLRDRGRVIKPAYDADQSEQFRSAHDVYGDESHTLEFYRAEWREVIQEQGLRTEDEYVLAVRKHRGIPLSRTERRRLWPVFQAYREGLERDGMMEPADILRLARQELETTGESTRYASVVVDETQDFSADALRLVRAIAGPERPDDLFLVGDAHQRIYRRATPLSQCGIQVRGRRSQTLRLNYRTTGAICRWSLRTLGGVAVDDLDEGKADARGYVSLREGDAPEVRCLATALDEERAVVETIKAGLELGWDPSGVCVVARTHHPLNDRFGPALERAGIATVLLDKNEPTQPGVRLATMHRVKGLEFPIVVLVGMSDSDVPFPTPDLNSDDPMVAALALLRERSLLYVAASRARDELFVFASGKLSRFIAPLASSPKRNASKSVPPARVGLVATPTTDRSTWDGLRVSLTDSEKATSLERMTLPARIRSFAKKEGLRTLGDLALRGRGDFEQAGNLGRTSLTELPTAVTSHFEREKLDHGLADNGLVECWKALLEDLEPVPRMVLTRRSGLANAAETLNEIGETLGVSRERIRQIEAAACKELTRRAWVEAARKRVDAALGSGSVALEELAADTWWSQAVALPEVLRYLVEDVLETEAFVIRFDDRDWLSRHKLTVVSEAWSDIRRRAAAVPLPAPADAFDALVLPFESSLGPRLGRELREQLHDLLKREEGGARRVVALGEGRMARLLALLRTSPTPIHMDDAIAQMGSRFNPPEEVIRFGGGTIGLRQHVPDFDEWRTKLVPAAVAIVRKIAPDRQWSCTELLDELREEFDVPEWLTPFVLAALVKSGDELTYLGRLRVALPGSPDADARTHVLDATLELLRDAGEPMARQALVEAIHSRIGVTDLAINQVLQRPQIVRVDLDRFGLLERDVPGGAGPVGEAADHIAAILDRRNRGLSSFHVQEEVVQLSPLHAQWTEQLTFSVLHGDARFRFSQSGAVGLAAWESTRVPTRLELVRTALAESEGRVSVEAVMARLEAHYGERPGRNVLASIAMQIGGSLAGEWLVKREG